MKVGVTPGVWGGSIRQSNCLILGVEYCREIGSFNYFINIHYFYLPSMEA